MPNNSLTLEKITTTVLIVAGLLACNTSSAEALLTGQIDRLSLQWQQIAQQRSHLDARWLKRKAVLDQQAELLDIEQASLKKMLTKDQQMTGDVEQKRTELLQQQIQVEQDQQQLETDLAAHLKNLLALQDRLPPPLQSQWRDTLTTAKNTAEIRNNSQQLELLLQLLSQLEDFENRIALQQVVMTIDGVDVQVQQFYMGLSQGWFVDNSGRYAGYGKSSENGWIWQTQSQYKALNPDELRKVVGILNNKTIADFVSLPVSLDIEVSTEVAQ